MRGIFTHHMDFILFYRVVLIFYSPATEVTTQMYSCNISTETGYKTVFNVTQVFAAFEQGTAKAVKDSVSQVTSKTLLYFIGNTH